jgi:DNA polymerase III delta prime subunit
MFHVSDFLSAANDGRRAAFAAAEAANEDVETLMKGGGGGGGGDDDDEAQAGGEGKRRKTSNTVLYNLFTREGVVKPSDKDGRQYVHCIACFEHCLALARENTRLPSTRQLDIQALVPTKRIKRDCEKHIRNCVHVSPEVKAQFELDSKPAPKSSRKATPASRLSGFGSTSSAPITIADVAPAKSFCTTGPCDPDKHYYLANRIGTETILQKIDQGSYCYVYGPPQTGKTTTCLEVAQELNQGGTYCAVRLSVAAAKWYDKPDEAWEAVLESWDRDIYSQLSADLRPTPGRNMRYYADSFREPIPEAISRWAHCCPRPLVLFIDDLQALANSGNKLYHSFLTQLMSGFHDRPKNFAYSICLVGESHRLPSHFNIVSESIRLPNFARPQVEAIMDQMNVDSSHKVEEDAKELILTFSQGQPWVVNAFGMILTNKMVEHPKMTFTVEHVNTVLALLIERMDPFLRRVVDIASDRIYGPILKQLATQQASCSHESKLEYLQEQGILSRDPTNGKYFPMCPDLYAELIDKAPASL